MSANYHQSISVPMYLAEMTPDAALACLQHRAQRARAKEPAQNHPMRRRMMTFGIVFVTAMLLCMGIVYSMSDTEQQPVEPVTTVAAQPPIAWSLTDVELAQVNSAVMGVARGESPLAMQAVAQCIHQTCSATNQPVSKVLADNAYPIWDGEPSQECVQAVQAVMNGTDAIAAPIYWCYNPAVQEGTWHQSRTLVCTIGNLKFFS